LPSGVGKIVGGGEDSVKMEKSPKKSGKKIGGGKGMPTADADKRGGQCGGAAKINKLVSKKRGRLQGKRTNRRWTKRRKSDKNKH